MIETRLKNVVSFIQRVLSFVLSRKIVRIALNVLSVKNEKIYPAYVSKHNQKHKKQVNLEKDGIILQWKKCLNY